MITPIRRRAIVLGSLSLFLLAGAVPVAVRADNPNRHPELEGDLAKLQVPEGNKVAYAAYAVGVQIYRWNGTSWLFVGPEAILFDWDGDPVGIHYAGPTWESPSGSKVVGADPVRATPDSSAIPWLRLRAVASQGPGIFHRVTYIQRLFTVGGLAPSEDGLFPGEEVRVPYTATYIFYRAHK